MPPARMAPRSHGQSFRSARPLRRRRATNPAPERRRMATPMPPRSKASQQGWSVDRAKQRFGRRGRGAEQSCGDQGQHNRIAGS